MFYLKVGQIKPLTVPFVVKPVKMTKIVAMKMISQLKQQWTYCLPVTKLWLFWCLHLHSRNCLLLLRPLCLLQLLLNVCLAQQSWLKLHAEVNSQTVFNMLLMLNVSGFYCAACIAV